MGQSCHFLVPEDVVEKAVAGKETLKVVALIREGNELKPFLTKSA